MAASATLVDMPTGSDLFRGPIEVMLTKVAPTIPEPAGTDTFAYEWKCDGYRACLRASAAGDITLWSRHGTDLSEVFPDLVASAGVQIPPRVVLDGVI